MEISPPSSGTGVSQSTRDKIVFALWMPVILVLNAAALAALGVGVGIFGLGIRMAALGELPTPAALGEATGVAALLSDRMLLLGVGAAVLGLYWLLAHDTFGSETVKDSIESAEDAKKLREDGGGRDTTRYDE